MFSGVLDRYADNPAVGVQFNQNILIDIADLDDFPVRKIDQERICIPKVRYFHVSYSEGAQ